MASTNDVTMTIRTNRIIKEEAQNLFADLGMDMSTAVNTFLRQCIKNEGIPFEITRAKQPNWKTRRVIQEAIDNKNMVGPFDTVEEAMKYLDA
ncbi:MAG: type II toxin-antitoxin system RelB/DinJ family antitoxin [Candidatus Saccharibacteria bacterium]|nr:type II toxin-antitoxin system RelB/DinJ family antitoxin [Candidatus Saccharibacteria bacterium]